jgi:hypothetical protein
MDTFLPELFGSECYAFIDDAVVYATSTEEHALPLENMLQLFDIDNLQLHPGNCVFAQPRLNYLGYVLSDKGITASADKVNAVKKYPAPKIAKDIRAFRDLTSFYRRLVPKFAEVAKPLTILTRNNQDFVWGPS